MFASQIISAFNNKLLKIRNLSQNLICLLNTKERKILFANKKDWKYLVLKNKKTLNTL